MKVRIDAGGREVEIECGDTNVSAKEMAAAALATWKQTEGATPPSDGPAFGLAASERRETHFEPLASGYERVVKA